MKSILKTICILSLISIFVFSTSAFAKTEVKYSDVKTSHFSFYSPSGFLTENNELYILGGESWLRFEDSQQDNPVYYPELTYVMSDVASFDVATYHFAAVKKDGSLWTWGYNRYGELCLGPNGLVTDEAKTSPVKAMDDVKMVSCGDYYTAVVKNDGSLWIFGNGGYGQHGNGTYSDFGLNGRKVMDNVKMVSAGKRSVAAVKKDGSLWTWGDNHYGQLGNGTFESSNVPVRIMNGVLSVSMGSESCAAIRTDNSLWMWGENSDGQLGTGTNDPHITPVKTGDDFISVSLSDDYTLAQKSDGSLWSWGESFWCPLGRSKNDNPANIPTKILDNVKSYSGSIRFAAAVKNDGSAWAWGENHLTIELDASDSPFPQRIFYEEPFKFGTLILIVSVLTVPLILVWIFIKKKSKKKIL